MANPQLNDEPITDQSEKGLLKGEGYYCRNGHVDIPNEVMEKLAKTRIPGEARQVLDFILRKTWGWHKNHEWLSLDDFRKGTGLNKPHIYWGIKRLLEMNLITRKTGTKKGNEFQARYGIQNHFENWKPGPKKVTGPKMVTVGTKYGPDGDQKQIPYTKRNSLKETHKRNYLVNSDEMTLSSLLFERINQNRERLELSPLKKPNLQKWAQEIYLILGKDGIEPRDVREIILWCQGNSFWWKNILSTRKLREQFERLEAEMAQDEEDADLKPKRPFERQKIQGIDYPKFEPEDWMMEASGKEHQESSAKRGDIQRLVSNITEGKEIKGPTTQEEFEVKRERARAKAAEALAIERQLKEVKG
jgi:phage replication O-like protein O